jgi:hypothetical protein
VVDAGEQRIGSPSPKNDCRKTLTERKKLGMLGSRSNKRAAADDDRLRAIYILPEFELGTEQCLLGRPDHVVAQVPCHLQLMHSVGILWLIVEKPSNDGLRTPKQNRGVQIVRLFDHGLSALHQKNHV